MPLTTGQVSQFCGVAIRTVKRWCDRGGLKSYKMPGKRGRRHRRVIRDDLVSFLIRNDMPLPVELQVDAGGV